MEALQATEARIKANKEKEDSKVNLEVSFSPFIFQNANFGLITNNNFHLNRIHTFY